MAILEKIPIRLCRQIPFPSSTDDHKYAPLSGLDANLQDSSPIEDLVPNKSRRQRIIACLATAHTAFWFLISLAFFIAYVKKQPTDQQFVKQLNIYCKFKRVSRLQSESRLMRITGSSRREARRI